MPSWLGWDGFLACSAFLLFFAGALFLIAIMQRNEGQHLAEPWSELARQAGLTFEPLDMSLSGFLFGDDRFPAVHGEYRGRHLRMARGSVYVEPPVDPAPLYLTAIEVALQLRNEVRGWLSLAPKGKLADVLQATHVWSGDEDFDRHFKVDGQPREYSKKASALLARTDPALLALLVQWGPRIVDLERSMLVCRVGIRTDVHTLISLFNLLCDLAETAEQLGKDVASPVK